MATELETAPTPVITPDDLEAQFNASEWCHLYSGFGPVDVAYCGAHIVTHAPSVFNGDLDTCPACGKRVCVECVAIVKEKDLL